SLTTMTIGSGSIGVEPLTAFLPYGSVTRLIAEPNVGSYFLQWANAASGADNPLSYVMTNTTPTISAVFALLPAGQSALTVIPDGRGDVIVNPPANRFTNGHSAVLRAIPEPGQVFLGWSGSATGTQSSLTITMNESKTVTAHFTRRPNLTLLP